MKSIWSPNIHFLDADVQFLPIKMINLPAYLARELHLLRVNHYKKEVHNKKRSIPGTTRDAFFTNKLFISGWHFEIFKYFKFTIDMA